VFVIRILLLVNDTENDAGSVELKPATGQGVLGMTPFVGVYNISKL
jgi:hypothetical protein